MTSSRDCSLPKAIKISPLEKCRCAWRKIVSSLSTNAIFCSSVGGKSESLFRNQDISAFFALYPSSYHKVQTSIFSPLSCTTKLDKGSYHFFAAKK